MRIMVAVSNDPCMMFTFVWQNEVVKFEALKFVPL